MTLITIGKGKHSFCHHFILFFAFAIAGGLSSCTPKETITDVYYLRNDKEDSVSLLFNIALYWDTCSVGSTDAYSYVMCEGNELRLPAHATVRLHPICRTYDNPATHVINPIRIIDDRTRLVFHDDTTEWKAAIKRRPPSRYPCMFTSDTVFSIYNTECWQTMKDEKLPYTYYHTFVIL